MEQRWSPFRVSEKKFKARSPPPDLSNVLDITTESHLGHWQGSPTAFDYSEVALNDNKAIALKPIPGVYPCSVHNTLRSGDPQDLLFSPASSLRQNKEILFGGHLHITPVSRTKQISTLITSCLRTVYGMHI